VSSELERELRDARGAIPLPDGEATASARKAALARLRRRRRRARALVLSAATVAVALAVGVTAGSLRAPTGTAAREPAVIGFVPEQSWYALQSPPPAVPGQQTVAVAANVPFAADDVVHGLVEPSGLPYSTLLSLPPKGIVLVATMVPETVPHVAPVPTATTYPKQDLPLRVRDGVTYLQWGAQVRPDQPLAQLQLRASIRHYNVDVVVYFGTSRPTEAQLDEAQRQLDGLVVRSAQSLQPAAAASATSLQRPRTILDRTYSCATTLLGGIYEVKNRAHAGIRSGAGWAKLPYAVAASGGWAGPLTGLPNAPSNSLAWITAGTPTADTTVGGNSEVFPVLGGGTIGVNKSVCKPSSAKVALTSTGLRGGAVSPNWLAIDCSAPKRVLVRIRASVQGTDALRNRARIFVATNAPASRAQLAVRTPRGKQLTYADVAQSGKTKLFVAKDCSG
jgi:hypothetical protein